MRKHYQLSEQVEFYTVMGRFINRIETLCAIGYPESLEETVRRIEEYSSIAQKFWGSAYVVTTHGIQMPKLQYLTKRVLPAAYERLGAGIWRAGYPALAPTLEQRHGQLMQLEGLGSFMAAQVVADLKNTEGHPLTRAPDWWTWSAWGPGSLRGLSWFFGQPITPAKYDQAMSVVIGYINRELPGLMISAQDVQNCLCEYDKYMRVRSGSGRSKRKYNGR